MPKADQNQTEQPSVNTESFTGRSVFLVETSTAGIIVQTALMTNDGQLLRAPAVFPDIEYAFTQIDELKRLVSRHFSEAARVGAQVVVAQQANHLQTSSTDAKPADEATAQDTSAAPKATLRAKKSKE